ncbi:MAG: Ni/Fe-hydrogenase, b-type cytochrome subunit [Gemmatimonadaceae bacterium]
MTPLDARHTRGSPWPSIDERSGAMTPEPVISGGGRSEQWVYLWHWPIRAMHWAAAVSIVVLAVTGFWIGRPYFLTGGASQTFALQYVRLAHFAAAGVLVATAIVRIYWLFVGDRFERLPALFPVRARDWANLWKMVKFYLLIHPERAPRYLGHNPLQQLSYTFTYFMAGLLVVTGFIMFGEANPQGVFMYTFGRLAVYVGGFQWVRVIHHVAAWYIPLFIIVHVYLTIRADLLERSGAISSIFSGGRFVATDEHYADE